MTLRRNLIGVVTISLSLLLSTQMSCSMVIDVEANCDDAACGAYTCDEDNVACLDTCQVVDDCSNGYECAGGRCTRISCVPVMQPRVLTLPTTIDELSASFAVRAAPDLNQLFVIVSNRDGLGFRRFFESGERVSDPPEDDILVSIVEGNNSRREFFPTVDFLSETESAGDGSRARFQYAYSNVADVRVALERGDLVVGSVVGPVDAQPPSETTLVRGQSSSDVMENVRFASTLNATLVAYLRLSARPSVQAHVSSFNRQTIVTETPVTLSEDGESGGLTTAFAASGLFGVAWSGEIGGQRRIRLSLMSEAGEVLGSTNLLSNQNAFSVDVLRLESATIAGGVAVFWLLSSDTDRQLWAMFLTNADIESLRVGGPVTAQPRQLEISVGSGILDVRTFAKNDEYGVAVAVNSGAEQALWLYRFDVSGSRILRPVELATTRLGVSPQYSLTDNPSGYGLVWREDGPVDAPDLAYLQRFICEGAD